MNYDPIGRRLDELAAIEQETLKQRDALVSKLADNEEILRRIKQERKELEQ